MSFDTLRSKFEQKPYLWAYVIGTAVFLLTFWAWWFKVHLGTQHVFWSMLENSLATSSVTMETSQGGGDSFMRQYIQADTGLAHKAHSLTVLKEGKSEVKTEVIGTPDADYTRYLHITSEKKVDVSQVLHTWAKSSDDKQTTTSASGHQLYAQAVLGVGLPLGSVPVPIGALTPGQRQDMMDFIKGGDVYKPDFSKVKKERKDGHLLYIYQVKIQTILYVRMMQQFAKDLGLHELDQVNPNAYQSTEPLAVELTVDADAHQLRRVSIGAQGGFVQDYTAYGLPVSVELPKHYISDQELQTKLGLIQGS